MTVLTFPTNPEVGDTYTGPNDVLYTFDGVKWIVTTTTVTDLAVSNFVQDNSASLLTNGTHTGIIVAYDTQTNELSLSLDVDGGSASTVF